MECVAIVPARLESTRFPGKLLSPLAGRPLIQHVVERCLATAGLDATVVASDDDGILEAAVGAGAEALRVEGDFASGTDRVAAAARRYDAGVVVNVQGDEALLDSRALGEALAAFRESDVELGTLRAPLVRPADLFDPDVVKVVVDTAGRALYFSRAPVPFPRRAWSRRGSRPGGPTAAVDGGGGADDGPGADDRRAVDAGAAAGERRESGRDRMAMVFDPVDPSGGPWWIHVGVYLYRRAALERWAALEPSVLERQEGLEQLRVLEAGETIHTWRVPEAAPAVNSPGDLERVEAALAARDPQRQGAP